jgi:hypothetical protein
MGWTNRFRQGAKVMVKNMRTKSNYSEKMLALYTDFAKGDCGVCHKTLHVQEVRKSGAGIEYRFACGHAMTLISLAKETKKIKTGESYSTLHKDNDKSTRVHVEISGEKFVKEEEEISLTKLFCHNFYPTYTVFKNDVENSAIDVIAVDENKNELFFQVTKMNNSEYWKELNTSQIVDLKHSNIEKLVEEALTRKSGYDAEIKKKIILLIDAKPGLFKEDAELIKNQLQERIKKSGFKGVWIVGVNSDLTHSILN